MQESEKQHKAPFEGILYAEVSAWITIAGVIIAVAGLIIGFLYGGGIINEVGFMKDLFGGLSERSLWNRDSAFSNMPERYWFLKEHMCGDELSMIGLVIACYGGVVGIWGMFASMFRKKEVLFYKKGLYTILAAIIATIMTLAATGVIGLR